MPEIIATNFINAAQGAGKGVSGSDALKATTICVLELDDETVVVGSATTYDTSDDAERRAAAYADAVAKVPAEGPNAVAAPEPTPEPAPEPEPEEPISGVAAALADDPNTAALVRVGDETTDAGNDGVTAASGDETVSGANGADALLASAEALATPDK